MWDPRNWFPIFAEQDAQEYRIYADDAATVYCRVSREDYLWACTRKWHINKPHKGRGGDKQYFRSRAGWRGGGGQYLHVAIMHRTGTKPASKKHRLVDHVDGDEWNCCRTNLVWTTAVKNASNQHIKRRRKGVEDGRAASGVDVFTGGQNGFFRRPVSVHALPHTDAIDL